MKIPLKPFNISIFAFVLVASLFISSIASAQTWTGIVTDIRTGDPLSDIAILGGLKGRKDASPRFITKTDGKFSVTYDVHLDRNYFILHADSKDYLPYREYRKNTGFAKIKLVPKIAHIKGRIVDADTGKPLAGIKVVVGVPGRYLVSGRDGYERVTTNSNGEYHVTVPAFERSGVSIVMGSQGIPEPDKSSALSKQYEPITNYWVEVNYSPESDFAKKYIKMSTRQRDSNNEYKQKNIPLTSSIKSDLYTEVNFKLPAKSSNIKPSLELVTVIPAGGDKPSNDECQHLRDRIDELIKENKLLKAEIEKLKR
jgi:hypothetical protein